jgi:replicative DNA helicase
METIRHREIASSSMVISILDTVRRCAAMIEPVPLIPEHRKINLYELPPFIGELSCGISRQFQIDPAIVFGTILGCIAAATQGTIRTRISPNWIEHSSLYIINIAETGDGKSQVMNLLRKPIDEYETQLQADALSDYGVRKAEHEIAENKLKAIKDSMSKTKSKNPATRADLMAAIENVAATKPKPMPRISIGGDVTPDALTDLLMQNPALAILDAEGTLYSHLSGRRHGTGSMWETILQAFTGDPIKVHRIGRDGGSITNPHLVINTSVQPKVWKEIIGDENAIGRGAVGRFLVFNAQSNVGYREPKANLIYPIDDDLMDRWHQTIRELLSNKEHRVFDLNPEQLARFDEMRERNERHLRDPDNRLDGFGMRLPGLLIRIAQLLTLMENPQAQQIDDKCLDQSLNLADYLIEQRVQADAISDRTHEQRCLDKIAQMMREHVGAVGAVNKPFIFSTRDLQQRIKGQSWVMDGGVKAIDAALMKLEKLSWIEIENDGWFVRDDLLNHRW